MATILGLFLLVLCVMFYLIPTLMAHSRKNHNAGAIFALNLLLGWTLVGWVIALVWALTKPAPSHGPTA